MTTRESSSVTCVWGPQSDKSPHEAEASRRRCFGWGPEGRKLPQTSGEMSLHEHPPPQCTSEQSVNFCSATSVATGAVSASGRSSSPIVRPPSKSSAHTPTFLAPAVVCERAAGPHPVRQLNSVADDQPQDAHCRPLLRRHHIVLYSSHTAHPPHPLPPTSSRHNVDAALHNLMATFHPT